MTLVFSGYMGATGNAFFLLLNQFAKDQSLTLY